MEGLEPGKHIGGSISFTKSLGKKPAILVERFSKSKELEELYKHHLGEKQGECMDFTSKGFWYERVHKMKQKAEEAAPTGTAVPDDLALMAIVVLGCFIHPSITNISIDKTLSAAASIYFTDSINNGNELFFPVDIPRVIASVFPRKIGLPTKEALESEVTDVKSPIDLFPSVSQPQRWNTDVSLPSLFDWIFVV
ncbi:hypothetical protein M9H77_02301 [Catharanthus roseus]|uniref:Uncharacterized protein n=1 Tax=Catharanthus roseus TaxID=4058 RepID=A0ACC0C8F4_CATRO|nr:hypothetical protein M9H77_02301 [Catharanthus roseus]